MDLFDRIAFFETLTTLKKRSQINPLSKQDIQSIQPVSSDAPSIQSASDRVSALLDQLLQVISRYPNVQNSQTQIYNVLTNTASQIDQIFKEISNKPEEIQSATTTLHQKVKNLIANPLFKPQYISVMASKSSWFKPFLTNEQSPNQETQSKPAFDISLAKQDIFRANKNMKDYLSLISKSKSDYEKSFYVSRLNDYVIVPLLNLYEKSKDPVSKQQIAYPASSLLGLIADKLKEMDLLSNIQNIDIDNYNKLQAIIA